MALASHPSNFVQMQIPRTATVLAWGWNVPSYHKLSSRHVFFRVKLPPLSAISWGEIGFRNDEMVAYKA